MALTKAHIRFKNVRKALGDNQEQFSSRLHIKQSQVSQIETGARGITDSIYNALEHYAAVSRAWVELEEGDMFLNEQQQAIKPAPTNYRTKHPQKATGNQALGEKLRFFREQEKISTKQLAFELNISTGVLNKYETGKLIIPVSMIVYLHDKYNMNYAWALNDQEPRKTTFAMRAVPELTIEHLYETQTLLVARLEYLENQLKIEKSHRVKQQREINALSLERS